MRLASLPRVLALATTILACASPARLGGQTGAAAAADTTAELVEVTERFARSFFRPLRETAAFFPASGSVTYVTTDHLATGDSVAVREVPVQLLTNPVSPGFLRGVLKMDVHAQPIGLFVHQIKSRQAFAPPLVWRRARGTRMVPADEPDDAPFFVEWRREDGRWVVFAFGDERFHRDPQRKWCC